MPAHPIHVRLHATRRSDSTSPSPPRRGGPGGSAWKLLPPVPLSRAEELVTLRYTVDLGHVIQGATKRKVGYAAAL